MRHFASLALLVLAACSSRAESAADQCRSTIDMLCLKNADCSVAVGEIMADERPDYFTSCKAGVTTTLDCSRQGHVLGNPDACSMDLSAMPCSFYVKPTGLPLPASCRNLYAP